MTLKERLLAYAKWQPNGCLLWTGAINRQGYGTMNLHGRLALTHRVAYSDAFGAIPKGYEIHHLCNTKTCFEVTHLALMHIGAHRRQHILVRYRNHPGHRGFPKASA